MNEQAQTDPRLAEAVRGVMAALEAPDQDTAIRLARAALDAELIHPLFLNLRAFWLERRGRVAEALADLERAHDLTPDDVPVLNALGLALARLDRPVEATAAFEKAIALQPDFVPAYFNHAWACEMWGELDRAQQSYEAAARLAGDQPAAVESLSRLAGLAGRRGDWEEARSLALRALHLVPGHTLSMLVGAEAETQADRFDSAQALLHRILTTTGLSPHDRYHAMGALADLRHRQARFADAYTIYTQGNAEYARAMAGRSRSTETALASVRWMKRYYERHLAPPVAAAPSPSAGESRCHVFLIGFIRSGTTLLEQVLASHPDILTMEEKEALQDSSNIFLRDAAGLDSLRALLATERARYVDAYWRRVHEQGFEPEGRIFVDKQPFNTLKLPLIAELFPDAKIIFAIRDPRDVLLSCLRRRLSFNSLTAELMTPESAARFYDAYMQFAEQAMAALPLDCHRIRHEDLVEEFEGEVGKVCDFLGIGWTEEMRNFAERRKVRAISSPSAAQIAKGLNREGIGQWRNYAAGMAPILPVLEPWVKHFGYSVD